MDAVSQSHRLPRVTCWSIFPVPAIDKPAVYDQGAHFSQAAGTVLSLRLASPDDSLLAKAPSKTLLSISESMTNTLIWLKWVSLLLKTEIFENQGKATYLAPSFV